MKEEQLTGRVIEAFYFVYNALGHGFLERVYENALLVELRYRGIAVEAQVPIDIQYRGVNIGEYFADLVVEDRLLLELKAVSALREEHQAQLLNYLKATRFELGLLLNFGPKPEIKRKIYDPKLKNP